VPDVRLAPLTLDEATVLATEVLKEFQGPVDMAKPIARVTRDCPLAIVMAAQIVAKEKHPLELAKNDGAFRSTLFGKFQDVVAGEIGDKNDANAIRKLLRVLALLQPFHPDDQVVAKIVESVEGLTVPCVNRLIRLLSEAGVLFKRGGQYRLSPDLLADFIIEKACIGEGGQSTAYAEQVFDAASGAHLQHLLVNLGKLDWRLSNGDPSTSRLMDGIWARLRQHHEPCVKAVAEVAYFQPERALEFADALISNGEIAFELTDLLKYASYSLACAPRACALMWQLATEHEQTPCAERAVKVLADLSAVEPNKPLAYNQLLVDFGLSLLGKEESWRGKFTPFHILEGMMRTEGDIHESVGRSLRIRTYSVSPKSARPLRQKVVDATVKLLWHADTKLALKAARFLKNAVHYPMHGGPRTEWTKEFVATLTKIEEAMNSESLDPLVIIEIARSVAWLAHYANDDASPVAKRILAAMPDSLEFRTTLGLVDEYGQIFERLLDYDKSERDRIERLATLTKDLIGAFPDAGDLYAYIHERLQHIRDHCGDEKGWSVGLFWKLMEALPSLVDMTIDKVLDRPSGKEIGYAGAALAMKLGMDRAGGISFAIRFLESATGELHVALSRAYNCLDPATFTLDDMAIVRKLLASPNPIVLVNALSVVRRIAGKDQRLAIDLLRKVDIGNSSDIADDVLGLFGHVIPLDELSEQDVQEYLDKLGPIPCLDGHWTDTFLAHASHHHAEITAQFFMKRVELAADSKDWRFRPCNYGPWGHIPLRFREAREFSAILRRVVQWMTSRDHDDFQFNEQAGQLFEAMFGLLDERILGFVADWIDVAKPAELQSIGAIFSKASEAFVFEHRALVVRLLEKADRFGKEILRRMISALYCAAIQGMRSGVPGEPFPQDITMKEEAEKALKEIPRFSPAYDLYDAVRKHAEHAIARCKQEAELFDD
jgi:hypothetical protein